MIAAAAVLVAGSPALVLLSGGSRHAPPADCTTRLEAGVMGGVTHTICATPP